MGEEGRRRTGERKKRARERTETKISVLLLYKVGQRMRPVGEATTFDCSRLQKPEPICVIFGKLQCRFVLSNLLTLTSSNL